MTTLQQGDTLNVFFFDNLWKCLVFGVMYQASTKAQLLQMIQNVYPITDHTNINQYYYDIVFNPQAYPLK